jgi:hypothetical protein
MLSPHFVVNDGIKVERVHILPFLQLWNSLGFSASYWESAVAKLMASGVAGNLTSTATTAWVVCDKLNAKRNSVL